MEQHDGNETCEYIFKVHIVGNSGTGKTSVMNCVKGKMFSAKEAMFDEKHYQTIGVDFVCKSYYFGSSIIKLQIWEMAGGESSFEVVDKQIKQYLEHIPEKCMLVLCGTHSDLEEQRQVSSCEALSKAEQHGMIFFEISAKLGTNIEYMFETLTKRFLEFPKTGLVLKTQRKIADTESKCC